MQGQQQHPPLHYNQQGYYGSDPTQRVRRRSRTAPQIPLENTYSGYIATDRNPAQNQNQQTLRRMQEDGGKKFHQHDYYESSQRQYPQREQHMSRQGARQVMGSSSQERPPHQAFSQAPRSPQARDHGCEYSGESVTITSAESRGAINYVSGVVVSRAKSHQYVNVDFTPGGAVICSPSEQSRGQDQGYPHNQQYPQTNQSNQQYPTTSQGYQLNQQHPKMNQGYQSKQPTNSSYPQNQQFPPTGQPYNVPNQQMQPGGQDQGYPHNQRKPPSYNTPNQGQAGGDQLQGAGVRRQDPPPPLHGGHIDNEGTYSAQSLSPQGPYGGSAGDVPPKVRQVPGPVAAPRSGAQSLSTHGQGPYGGSAVNVPQEVRQEQGPRPSIPSLRYGRRTVQEKSQSSPPTYQRAYSDQPCQPHQLLQHDELAQTSPENETSEKNVLLRGIDDDIHHVAEQLQGVSDEEDTSLEQVQFDPNLVCPYCMKQFRLGEIQKCKRHVKECDKEKEERERMPPPQTPTEWVSNGYRCDQSLKFR